MKWQKKIGDCYFNYGLIEMRRNNPDDFLKHTLKAVEIYVAEKAWHDAARANTSLAQAHVTLKNYPAAYIAFNKSLELRELIADSTGIVNNLINIGNLYYLEGNLADASMFFYRALHYADLLDNKNLAAIALMNMSNVLINQANHEKAIEYLEKALAYHRTAKNRKEEANVLHNLGIVYFETKNNEQAKSYYLKALAIHEELKAELPVLVKIYNNLGLIAKEEGDFEEATEFFEKALQYARSVDDRFTEAAVLNNLGSMKINQRMDDGLPLIIESLGISRELGLRKLVLSNYNNLVQHYTTIKDFEKALDYSLQYKALNDSLYTEEVASKIIELQTRYDTEMKEKENQILRNHARILQLRILILTISILTIIIISVALISLQGLKRKSLKQNMELLEKENKLNRLELEKQEKETQHLQEIIFAEEQINKLQSRQIQEKNRELTASTLHIINKNEVLNNMRQIAFRALKDDNFDGKSCIRQLIGEVDNNINLDEQWETFKLHFESVHTGFFARLREKHPALTQNDLKLCAYLRMNLSSKEIAQMLNISLDSGITKRYRLRKKLQLENDENLVAYLSEF